MRNELHEIFDTATLRSLKGNYIHLAKCGCLVVLNKNQPGSELYEKNAVSLCLLNIGIKSYCDKHKPMHGIVETSKTYEERINLLVSQVSEMFVLGMELAFVVQNSIGKMHFNTAPYRWSRNDLQVKVTTKIV